MYSITASYLHILQSSAGMHSFWWLQNVQEIDSNGAKNGTKSQRKKQIIIGLSLHI